MGRMKDLATRLKERERDAIVQLIRAQGISYSSQARLAKRKTTEHENEIKSRLCEDIANLIERTV